MKDGMIEIPDRPGLGITVREDFLAKHTVARMRALFLGNVAADTYEGIRDELPPGLEATVLPDPPQILGAPDAAAAADILVSNHWRAEYPPAPRIRLVQSVATGVELFDLAALPKGAAVCNAFGHETAIAEYIVMTWLALHHRLFQIAGEFRERGSWRTSWVESGAPHGEVRGSTLGIVGYGRVGREVARRAAPFGARILAANRTPRERRSRGRAGLSARRARPHAAGMRCGGDLHRARSRDDRADRRAPPRR